MNEYYQAGVAVADLIVGGRYVRINGSGSIWVYLGNGIAECVESKGSFHFTGEIRHLYTNTKWFPLEDPFLTFAKKVLQEKR